MDEKSHLQLRPCPDQNTYQGIPLFLFCLFITQVWIKKEKKKRVHGMSFQLRFTVPVNPDRQVEINRKEINSHAYLANIDNELFTLTGLIISVEDCVSECLTITQTITRRHSIHSFVGLQGNAAHQVSMRFLAPQSSNQMLCSWRRERCSDGFFSVQ